MTNTSCIIDMTNGAFDIVAHGLTFVDATNQAMTLEYQIGGKFRQVFDTNATREAYAAWQNEASRNYDPSQGGWAFL